MATPIVSSAASSRRRLGISATVFLFVAAPAYSQAAQDKDVVVFTNGDQLSGTLERSHGGSIVFKSDMAGEITIPLSKVKELHAHGNYAVLKNGEPTLQMRQETPGKIAVSGDTLTLTAPGGASQTVPLNTVDYVIDAATFSKEVSRKDSVLYGWSGAVNLGTSYVQAFSHGGTITGGVALVRQVPTLSFFPTRNKTILNFQENFGVLTSPVLGTGGTISRDANGNEVTVQVKTSIMHADAERDEYLSKRLYVLAVTSFDHNYSQSLDLQQIYGGGFGWTPIKQDLQQLDLKVDGHYERQQFFDRTLNLNLFGSTFAENYRRALPLKMTLTQTLALVPAWTDLHAYSGNASVAVVAPLFRRLSMNLTAADSYLNNPAPGFLKNSFTLTTGLTYSLR